MKHMTKKSKPKEKADAPARTAHGVQRTKPQLDTTFGDDLIEALRGWEQGTRRQDSSALRLLQLAEQHPQWVLGAIEAR